MKICPEVSYTYYNLIEMGCLTHELDIILKLNNVDVDKIYDLEPRFFERAIKEEAERLYQTSSSIEKSLIAYYFITEMPFQMDKISTSIVNILEEIYVGKDRNDFMLSCDSEKEIELRSKKFKDLFLIDSHQKIIKETEYINNYLIEIEQKYHKYIQNINHSFQEAMVYYYSTRNFEVKDLLSSLTVDLDNTFEVKRKEEKRKEEKKIKKVFNKSLKILSKFIGKEDTKGFIKGEDFIVEGNKYNYKMKSSGNLLRNTGYLNNSSIQYSLELYNKQNDFLSNLCVVFPGSPILDQVLSVYLLIQSDSEDKLLLNSNLYNKKEENIVKDKYLCSLKNISYKDCDIKSSFLNEKLSPKEIRFKEKRNVLKSKIKRNILNKLKIPKIVKKEMIMQELTFDEKVDYVGVNISMPTHLDFLNNSLS